LRFDIVGEEDALIFHVHREIRNDIQAYKETECQRHAPVYQVCTIADCLLCILPHPPFRADLIKKRVLVPQDPMFGHDKAVWW
jgi:hypothetical protein